MAVGACGAGGDTAVGEVHRGFVLWWVVAELPSVLSSSPVVLSDAFED